MFDDKIIELKNLHDHRVYGCQLFPARALGQTIVTYFMPNLSQKYEK